MSSSNDDSPLFPWPTASLLPNSPELVERGLARSSNSLDCCMLAVLLISAFIIDPFAISKLTSAIGPTSASSNIFLVLVTV